MTLRIEARPYGAPALQALRHLIDEAKGDDPFTPVTVVVTRGPVGLAMRRALAEGRSSQGRPGVVNVTFVTLENLADSLAGVTLVEEGKLPLTDAVLRASVRGVVSERPTTMLGSAGDHPSTVDALVSTYRELRTVDPATLERLAGRSRRAGELVEVVRAARQLTANWFDDVDVLDAATHRVGAGRADLARIGPIVLYLPLVLRPPAARLVAALATRVSCSVVIGVTGDAASDDLAHQLVAALRPDLDVVWPEVAPAVGDRVLSAPTVDAELLLVLRDLMARCAAGTPLERMAIAHAGSSQYVTLLHTMLGQADIPFNGGGIRPLSSTVAGRTLLGALTLPDHGWRRDEVAQWLNTGPIVQHDRPIAATRWDVLSAEAGVTEGLAEWQRQLERRANALRAEATDGEGTEEDESWRLARLIDAGRCEELWRFLEEVATRLEGVPATWSDWAAWAKALLHRLVGGPRAIEAWPPEERAAAEAVEGAIDGLAVLAQLGTRFSPPSAKAALMAELATPAPQTTRFGTGVQVASLSSLVGLEVDVLYIVGMNDGHFPGRPSEDVLLPDAERRDVGDGAVPLRGARPTAMRRDYLATLAGAGTALLSYPRGNQRDGRELRPSRWILDAVGAVTGAANRLYSGDLDQVRPNASYRVEPSFMTSVSAADEPFNLPDRDLQGLLRWRNDGRLLADHYLNQKDPRLQRGLAFLEGRRAGFNRFNGNLDAQVPPEALVPPLFSATRLERFAKCPRQYFFETILDVTPRPVSERLVATDRMAYGSLVHRILERFVRDQLGQRPNGGPDDPFGSERLMDIATEEILKFESEGLSGPRSSWKVEQVRLRRELRQFVAKDMAWRQESGIAPTDVEQAFGRDGVDPVAVPVPGGQPVQFRGSIDRVDATPGGAMIVSDYKTGNPTGYRKVEKDHFQRGSAVQLPIYALAVGARADQPVRADYWCVTEAGKFQRFGFEVDADALEELGRVVGVLTSTMANGQFPANPVGAGGTSPCGYCPYDQVCPTDRHESWAHVREDPALAGYSGLVEPP